MINKITIREVCHGSERRVLELLEYESEQEWFEFKENWFSPDALGEYVSAISNAAAFHYQTEGYFIWGVEDKTHRIVGTTFSQYCNYNCEPYQNYLARNLSPSIDFRFEDIEIDGKKVVVLVIPAATDVPTAYKDKRYTRIGSSKTNIRNYPKREIHLFRILDGRASTIETQPSEYQNLTFRKLFGYYGSRGIVLKEETFEKNLNLRTKNGEYNVMAQLLSDDSHIPLRVSIFEGKTKASRLISVREFGNNCILYTLDNLIFYGDALNLVQTDERERNVERKESTLFNGNAYREVVVNAVLHNYWAGLQAPMISVFSDRIEILSQGSLAPAQTVDGFYRGESVPVNEKLSEIFLELHISEKSLRGVPVIIEACGRDAVTITQTSIIVTIPFSRVKTVEDNISKEEEKETGKKSTADSTDELNPRRKKILEIIRDNPRISKAGLSKELGISTTAVSNNISFLRSNGYIERIGSTKGGSWKLK